jgi:hypothetical protein
VEDAVFQGEDLVKPEELHENKVIISVAAPKDDSSDLDEPQVAKSPIIFPLFSSDGLLAFDPT